MRAPRPVTLLMFRARQGRRSQGRTTKEVALTFEEEDAASGGTGRPEPGRGFRSRHYHWRPGDKGISRLSESSTPRRRPAREAATLARLDARAWPRTTPEFR